MQFSSIWPIDRNLSSATTPGRSGSWSDGHEGVLYIPQSSTITGTSPSDCLVLCPGHWLGVLTPLQRCSRCILQLQPTVQEISRSVISILNELELICLPSSIAIVSTQSNGFDYCYLLLIILFNINHVCTQGIWYKYCYVSLTIQLNISHLFTHS